MKEKGKSAPDSAASEEISKSTKLIGAVQENELVVTKRELWCFYLYFNGANGVGPYNYTLTLLQNLATAAGYDPTVGPGSSCLSNTASGKCVLPWMGGTKPVASVILIANGISFAFMTAIFTTIGSAGDYGTFGRWLLFAVIAVCWVAQFACMALTSPDRWKLAMVLYIIGFVAYGAILVFYAAAFPRLARNTPRSRELRERYEDGKVPVEEYERERGAHNYIGFVVASLLNLTLLIPPKIANDPKVDNYVLLLDNVYAILLGVWWFIYQEPRPGPPLPKGENYLTIGWKQIWTALKTYKHLPYTFIYLFAFFLLADGVNTTGTLISICQNDKFSFSFLQNTYLGLSQSITSSVSTLGFWYIQRYWKISTKKMLVVTNVVTILIPLWGMIGIWTDKLGFHNAWEFWRASFVALRVLLIELRVYNVMYGVFQAPYYAYAQTMMAELCPPGFDNMFFGLYGLSNRVSSMVGPYVVQVIIDKTQYNWYGFPFLFGICTGASLVIWFGVDVAKGRRDAVRWAALQRD